MIYIKDDITNVTIGIIAHGVNRRVTMGSGVAKALYEKWQIVKTQYMTMKSPVPTLGSIDIVNINDDLMVINCYTQEFYGYQGVYANIDSVVESMERCCLIAINNGLDCVNIPKIGAGLGGLNWDDIEPRLCKLEEKHKVFFNVYHLD